MLSKIWCTIILGQIIARCSNNENWSGHHCKDGNEPMIGAVTEMTYTMIYLLLNILYSLNNNVKKCDIGDY